MKDHSCVSVERVSSNRVTWQIIRSAMKLKSKISSKLRKFECPECGSTFKRKRTLNYHVSHKHGLNLSSHKSSPRGEVKIEELASRVPSQSDSKSSSDQAQ